MKLRTLLEQLQPLEDVILDNEKSFLDKFCHGGTDITKLSFSSENCYVTYIITEGQHICNHVKISDLSFWFKEIGYMGGF